MPALSPTMTQGNIGAWKKREGEAITAGDVLCEIETDKATMDFECQEEGFLAKILAKEGTKDWEVGRPVAVLVEEKADVAAFKDYKAAEEHKEVATADSEESRPSKSAPSQAQPSKSASSQAQPTRSAPQETAGRIIASPVAKMLAKDHDVNLSTVAGSGPNSRILKHDVLAAIRSPSAKPSGAAYTDIPLTSIRKVIAQRLTDSKQAIPHYYLTSEIDMARILAVRRQMNEAGRGEYKISINDFIVKAAAMAMRAVPEVNSAWHETFIRQHSKVDISVAVATDTGLITPIVADANLKGLQEISTEVKALADLAKRNRLRPEQFQGGTFTISNLGMFQSISSFTAIINPPQSCILAVGSVQKRLVPAGDGIQEADMMHVTMSCDHRVVDGATGARWLSCLKKFLEEPAQMLL